MRLLTLILLLFSANFVAESAAPCGNYIGDDLDHIGTVSYTHLTLPTNREV